MVIEFLLVPCFITFFLFVLPSLSILFLSYPFTLWSLFVLFQFALCSFCSVSLSLSDNLSMFSPCCRSAFLSLCAGFLRIPYSSRMMHACTCARKHCSARQGPVAKECAELWPKIASCASLA